MSRQAGARSVFRTGDSFYALNNHCPHQGGPLCLGRTKPWLRSAGPDEYATAEQEALLTCPWHGWEYDLAIGRSFLGPGEPPVRTYEVSVEAGAPKEGRMPGPYLAETFAVHVEEPYVVVGFSLDNGLHARDTFFVFAVFSIAMVMPLPALGRIQCGLPADQDGSLPQAAASVHSLGA